MQLVLVLAVTHPAPDSCCSSRDKMCCRSSDIRPARCRLPPNGISDWHLSISDRFRYRFVTWVCGAPRGLYAFSVAYRFSPNSDKRSSIGTGFTSRDLLCAVHGSCATPHTGRGLSWSCHIVGVRRVGLTEAAPPQSMVPLDGFGRRCCLGGLSGR